MTGEAKRTVLITGGGRGIGYELAKLCAGDGDTVVIADIAEAALVQAVEDLRAGGASVHGHVHDISDPDACRALARRVAEEVGPIDTLVNNAGVVHKGDFLAGDDTAWASTVDVNLSGTMWMMRAFMPAMVARGEGQVVNVASILGLVPAGGAAAYCATKHAVVALTEAVRHELAERGVTGVSLTVACPGFTATGMFAGVKTPAPFAAVPATATARAIHRAMRRRTRRVIYPGRFRFLPQLYATMPAWLWGGLTRLVGVHRAMDTFAPRR